MHFAFARAAVALVAIASFGLAGCSGGGSAAPAAPQTPPTVTPASGGTTIASIASLLVPASTTAVQTTGATPVGGTVDVGDTATLQAGPPTATDIANANGASVTYAHKLGTLGSHTSATKRSIRETALNSPFDVSYLGGPVLGSALQHNVFVNCLAACRSAENLNPGTIQDDLNHDQFITLLFQYLASPNVQVATPLTGRYPHGQGTDVPFTFGAPPPGFTNNFLSQHDLLVILAHAIVNLGFPGGGQNHIYHLFLPQNTDTCFAGNTSCYSPDNPSTFAFCAYHAAVNFGPSVGIALFTVEPYGDVPGCNANFGGPNALANGSDLQDATAITMTHEIFETITDPLGDSWFQELQGNEVADLCAGFQNTVSVNHHKYVMQSEYSDIGHECVSANLAVPSNTPTGN